VPDWPGLSRTASGGRVAATRSVVLERPVQTGDRLAVRCKDGSVLGTACSLYKPKLVIPRFMRGTHFSAAGAENNFALTAKLNHGSREHVAG